MATEAQIAANRRNARKSTGPRTEEGKKRSSINALDHGCRANVLVMPGEDVGEYEKLSDAWKRSIRPRNPTASRRARAAGTASTAARRTRGTTIYSRRQGRADASRSRSLSMESQPSSPARSFVFRVPRCSSGPGAV